MDLIDADKHPLLYAVAENAKWVGKDEYPSCAEWVNEHEKWLQVAKATGGWDGLLPRLRSLKTERDEAMAEVQAAYFSRELNGYKVLAWEPAGAGNTKGEFLLGMPDADVFTEVKSPGWEDEVVRAQGWRSPRLKLPKHLTGEGKAVDACTPVRRAVAKAYPKLLDSMATLLIIADDLTPGLNSSVILVKYALYRPRVEGGTGAEAEGGCFVGRQYERLGTVGILERRHAGRRRQVPVHALPQPERAPGSRVASVGVRQVAEVRRPELLGPTSPSTSHPTRSSAALLRDTPALRPITPGPG